MARSTREPSCKLTIAQVGAIFPADEQPLAECVLCQLARSDGKRFFCGMIERIEGRFINRPDVTKPATSGSREVRLSRGIVVDGSPIPAGTALRLIRGKTRDRVWCRHLTGRASIQKFLVSKDALDFGEDVVEVAIINTLTRVFLHAVQLGTLLLPRRSRESGHHLDLFIDGEWVAAENADSYIGQSVTGLRLPLWLAREKGLTVKRR